MRERNSRVMVYRTGHLGDTLCAIPAFRRLREHFDGTELTLLCDQPSGDRIASEFVVRRLNVFEHITCYRSGLLLVTLLRLVACVRRLKPDIVFFLSQERETPWSLERKKRFFRWCGVRDVRGVCIPVLNRTWQPTEAERLVQLLRALGVKGPKPPYAISVDRPSRDRVVSKLAQLGVKPDQACLVFCGGGKAPTQQWEISRYAQVLRAMHERFRLPIVAVGNAGDLHRYEAGIRPVFPDLRIMPQLDLGELFELCRLAVAYFGNDTGPMHVAAAVGCPVAAVISGRNWPGAWDPDVEPRLVFRHRTECEGCFLQDCIREKHRCMTQITAEEVIAGLLPFLASLVESRGAHEPARLNGV